MALVRKIFKWLVIGLVCLLIIAAISGSIYQEISESRDLERFPAPGRLVDVDGHLMHIHCRGQGTPTVVLELGIGSSAAAWDEIHQQLALVTRVCAYDRTGLGYSEPADIPRQATDVAERLHKLLGHAGIDDDLVLVGWSAGGVYIREYHRQFPEKVKAMLFVDSSHEQQANRLPRSSDDGSGNNSALRIGQYLAPFGLIRLSGVLNRRVEASSASDELKARLKAIYHQSHIFSAVLKESNAFDLDISSDQPPASLGDLLLIVLTRGKPDTDYEATLSNGTLESQQERWEARKKLQQELTALSINGRQIIASKSGHHIYADQPELVVESVKELVQLVRNQ